MRGLGIFLWWKKTRGEKSRDTVALKIHSCVNIDMYYITSHIIIMFSFAHLCCFLLIVAERSLYLWFLLTFHWLWTLGHHISRLQDHQKMYTQHDRLFSTEQWVFTLRSSSNVYVTFPLWLRFCFKVCFLFQQVI